MHRLLTLALLAIVAACGMKGDLVLPESSGQAERAGEAAQPTGNAEEEAAKRRGVNPPTADPDVISP